MKTISKISIILLISALAFINSSCNDSFDDPAQIAPGTLPVTHSIKELKSLFSSAPVVINTDVVISGKVISTDEAGNIYRELYIQDETSGITVKIGKTGLYNDYKPGQTLYIRCKGLTLGAYGGMVQLGYKSTDPKYQTAYIDADYLIKRDILPGKRGDVPAAHVVTISNFAANPDWIGTLIKLENVTFSGTDYPTTYGAITTWALPNPPDGSDPITVSQKFIDGSGKTIIVRSSGYARFAGVRIPSPDVSIPQNAPIDLTGILTIFNGTYQLTLRTLEDVHVRK